MTDGDVVVQGAAGREPPTAAQEPPRFMFRVMNIPILRRAPWLAWAFFFVVAVGLSVMCIRLQIGDDLVALICAAVTVFLILSTGLCVWLAIRKDRAARLTVPPKPKRLTVCLTAHSFGEQDVEAGKAEPTCYVCLTDLEMGQKVVKLDCGHLYHVDCICGWTKRVAVCPACRFSLPTFLASAQTSSAPTPRNDPQEALPHQAL